MEHNDTNFFVPTSYEDEVYMRCTSSATDSPHLLYFPSRPMMFKIMRACIGIHEVEELWYMELEDRVEECSPVEIEKTNVVKKKTGTKKGRK